MLIMCFDFYENLLLDLEKNCYIKISIFKPLANPPTLLKANGFSPCFYKANNSNLAL